MMGVTPDMNKVFVMFRGQWRKIYSLSVIHDGYMATLHDGTPVWFSIDKNTLRLRKDHRSGQPITVYRAYRLMNSGEVR